jgi:RNA polymerase sigma-70 factor (ECF subfamily)
MFTAESQILSREDGTPRGESESESVVLSFREIYEQHATFVWKALRRLGVRSAEIEDACQDVFIVVHSKLGAFDWSRPMRPWLLGISVKVAAKYRRKAHLRREVAQEAHFGVTEPVQAKALERRQARALLEHILDHLRDDQREVFVLFELQEIAMAEVARIIGIPHQTAYSRLYAARRRVDAKIRQLQGPTAKGGGHGS